MSVVSTKLLWTGQTGRWQGPKLREYTAVWLVEVDDPRDGPVIVLATSAIPPLYSNYVLGNDIDGLAFLEELVPTRLQEEGRLLWQVTGQYRTAGKDEQGEDEDGKPTDNPLDFRETMDVSFSRFSVPVERAVYRGGMVDGAETKIGLEIDSEGPVLNSPGAVFDPPLEADAVKINITIEKPLLEYPATHDDFVNLVNHEQWTLDRPKNKYNKTFEPYTVKAWVSGAFQITNGTPYWKMRYELEAILHRFITWRFDVLDRGVHRRAHDGDHDGRGGVFADADFKDGEPRLSKIIDKHGDPISEPILLDGDGKPLTTGSAPVYLTYSYYDEFDFNLLELNY